MKMHLLLGLAGLFLANIATIRAQSWPDPAVRAHWTRGKAEITSYTLAQARYGELREGDAVMIFVTEPFSRSKQVKLDDWSAAGDDLVQVLKLNFTRQFRTGIYPYSLMLSTFTPADAAPVLKTSVSIQEWCGHVFGQLNLRGDHYDAMQQSYFEAEGDTRVTLPAAPLEDGLWTLIRLAPGRLPVGDISLIPGAVASRFSHMPQRVEKARATRLAADPARFDATKISGYQIEYITGPARSLTIWFESTAPHGIVAWEETHTEPGGQTPLTTRAVRKAVVFSDYWNHHSNADLPLRDTLKLPR